MILIFVCFSCNKIHELETIDPEILYENSDAEYEGLVNLSRSYSNDNIVVNITFWAESQDKISEFLKDHTLSIRAIYSKAEFDENNFVKFDRIVNDISEFKTDLILDYEVVSKSEEATGFALDVKSNFDNIPAKSSFLYTTTHKSANDFVKGIVTHFPKQYSDDDIEVDWYYTKCALCFWYHGKNAKLDDGESSTYIGPTTYKIRAIVGYNYYNNYSISFMQP